MLFHQPIESRQRELDHTRTGDEAVMRDFLGCLSLRQVGQRLALRRTGWRKPLYERDQHDRAVRVGETMLQVGEVSFPARVGMGARVVAPVPTWKGTRPMRHCGSNGRHPAPLTPDAAKAAKRPKNRLIRASPHCTPTVCWLHCGMSAQDPRPRLPFGWIAKIRSRNMKVEFPSHGQTV